MVAHRGDGGAAEVSAPARRGAGAVPAAVRGSASEGRPDDLQGEEETGKGEVDETPAATIDVNPPEVFPRGGAFEKLEPLRVAFKGRPGRGVPHPSRGERASR